MKKFALVPGSQSFGVLYTDNGVRQAMFLTPREAKFQAAFESVREAKQA